MKIRPTPLVLLALPLLASFARADAPAAPATPAAAAPAPGPQQEKKTELEKRMDRMGKAFRKLKKQVADPAQNASSLELVATIQAAAKEALQFTPAKAEDLPEDQRAKFNEDFKAGINQLLDKLSGLKEAIAAGKNDEASRLFAEIGNFEKKEHKEFRRPEKS